MDFTLPTLCGSNIVWCMGMNRQCVKQYQKAVSEGCLGEAFRLVSLLKGKFYTFTYGESNAHCVLVL